MGEWNVQTRPNTSDEDLVRLFGVVGATVSVVGQGNGTVTLETDDDLSTLQTYPPVILNFPEPIKGQTNE